MHRELNLICSYIRFKRNSFIPPQFRSQSLIEKSIFTVIVQREKKFSTRRPPSVRREMVRGQQPVSRGFYLADFSIAPARDRNSTGDRSGWGRERRAKARGIQSRGSHSRLKWIPRAACGCRKQAHGPRVARSREAYACARSLAAGVALSASCAQVAGARLCAGADPLCSI